MKKALYLFGIAFLFSAAAIAQNNNAILFTENGEKFQVILNGILQNTNPETNVKMTQLSANQYKCRIVFADKNLGFVDFNMFFNEMGYEVTWNIKQNKKGEYVTRYISAVPIAQAPQSAPSQTVVVYTPTPATEPVSSGTTTTTTTHSQTTTTTNGGGGTSGDNVNFNMGVSDGSGGGSISINASGFGMDDDMTTSSSSSSTTTTTTIHSSTTTTSGGGTVVTNNPPPTAPPAYVPGYSGKIGCPRPMYSADFDGMKETIRSKDFETTKLTIAKQILQDNCLTAQQVKEVLQLFDFESTKVDYAKYAYDHTYDIGNYYKINDAFEFESSVTDVSNYISGRR